MKKYNLIRCARGYVVLQSANRVKNLTHFLQHFFEQSLYESAYDNGTECEGAIENFHI